jgi:hypothetical protein
MGLLLCFFWFWLLENVMKSRKVCLTNPSFVEIGKRHDWLSSQFFFSSQIWLNSYGQLPLQSYINKIEKKREKSCCHKPII